MADKKQQAPSERNAELALHMQCGARPPAASCSCSDSELEVLKGCLTEGNILGDGHRLQREGRGLSLPT